MLSAMKRTMTRRFLVSVRVRSESTPRPSIGCPNVLERRRFQMRIASNLAATLTMGSKDVPANTLNDSESGLNPKRET
jgi:hypothetical protein